jgi:L,D-peptidoglycan transpeptidase YkuD (ErfK/YbiS/YcfS/YnhG family)
MLVMDVLRRGSAVLATAALWCTFGSLPASASAPPDTSGAVHPVGATYADQVIVVSASDWGQSSVTVTGYGWNGGAWVAQVGPVSGYIGTNGFTATPHEADGYTPIGQYWITNVFGAKPDPGTQFDYQQTTTDDHWIDDPMSAVYNTWQTGAAAGRWSSAENLSSYGYAVAFDFNQGPVVADGNSAIFFHGGGGPSPGCIEVNSTALVAFMKWLNPDAHPQIVLGVQQAPPPRAVVYAAAPTTRHWFHPRSWIRQLVLPFVRLTWVVTAAPATP